MEKDQKKKSDENQLNNDEYDSKKKLMRLKITFQILKKKLKNQKIN